MSTHYIVPTFNKSTLNKVHNGLVVTGQNTVSHPTESGDSISAIGTESIPATVGGEYIFAVRIDSIGQSARVMIGVTPMEAFDSNRGSYPGANGLAGAVLYLGNGNFVPGNSPNLIPSSLSTVAKEIIVVVTISPGRFYGHNCFIRWIVDGHSSVNLECNAHCSGNKLFPVISLDEQNQQFTTIPISQVTIRTGEVPALLKKYQDSLPLPIPVLMYEALTDNFPDQLALKLRRDTVHSVLFGLASAGKSTAFNFINYVLHGGKFAGGRPTGEAAVAGGQFSTQCAREEASFYLKWDVKQKGDLLLTDTVGFKGDESELAAIGNGKLKHIEAWPRDNSEASNFKRVEILNRPPQTTRPTCFVLFISADQLMNKNDKANDAIVNSVLEAAKTKFRAGDHQVDIPLITVITKVDKMESNPTKEDLLLQRTSPNLSGIFKECHERFGVAQDDIFALGFMDETDVSDFSSTTKDPRVLTVRHLLLRIAEGAQICAQKFKKHEQSNSPSSPNQSEQKKKNGNDEDYQQQKQFAAVAAAYGCANPVVVVAGHGEPSVADVTGFHHRSVSESGNTNIGASSVESIAAVVEEKEKQLAYFTDKMDKAGSKKIFIESLDKDILRSLLICKNVAEPIIKAIHENDCTGFDFVDDSFVATVLTDETKKKYNIGTMSMMSFNKIRDALIQ